MITTNKNNLGQPVGLPVAINLPRPRPPDVPMEGRACRLVRTHVSHAPALYEAFARNSDGRNWTYLPYGPFDREADFTDWMQAACFDDDPMFHTICTPDGAPAGLATFMRIDPDFGVVEVGNIHFSPLMQGTTMATEAMYLMMKRAFDELGYRRYEWKCDALNAPSRAAAQRLGFVYEGTFRQALVYKGRNRDTAWFSITDGEWPPLKAAFETWMEPVNFDANGRQRHRLSDLQTTS